MRLWLLRLVCAALVASVCSPAWAVQPHQSETHLPFSNGLSSVAYNAQAFKLDQFLEHPYANASSTAQTRNFVYDSYPGIRIGTTGTWLNTVAPTVIEYLAGTGVVHTMRTYGGLTLDEYHFSPMGLTEYASIMLVKVTRTSGQGAIDAFSLFNYHLGSGSPSPGTDSETISYDATNDALYESGPSGVAFAYGSIPASSYHGSSPDNPFASLTAGTNLADNAGTGGPMTDAVGGLQQSLTDLPVGGTAWAGWYTVLAPDANGAAAAARVRTWIAGRTSDVLLASETAAWNAWVTPAPAGATSAEAALDAQAQVLVRMGQVTEVGYGYGQILASIAPGQWNISWVRDMAYATVGLARSGHYVAFQMGANVGGYQMYVGAPYQISVVRYYGNGTEWSDFNTDGPNIEFDGFGLFLWELEEYVKASGDTQSLMDWWPVVGTKVGDVLVGLQENTGLIAADSSIWEVHWNGQQKHFGYTTLAAGHGLCLAASLASTAGDAARAAKYQTAGESARDALLSQMRAPDGAIGSSTEALASGTKWLDASELEAINFGLIDPTRHTAQATIADIEAGLVPPSGRGFMRDDNGAYYDSQEWVFIDLRAARSLELYGDAAGSASLFGWNVAQAQDNFGELSELHDATTADYAGASPMVGFGSGAYLIRLSDRGTPASPVCGAYANEPGGPSDAGIDATPGDAAPPPGDAGGDSGTASGDGGGDAGPDVGPDAGEGRGDIDAGAGGTKPNKGSGCATAAPVSPGDGPVGALVGLAAVGLVVGRRARRRIVMSGRPNDRTTLAS